MHHSMTRIARHLGWLAGGLTMTLAACSASAPSEGTGASGSGEESASDPGAAASGAHALALRPIARAAPRPAGAPGPHSEASGATATATTLPACTDAAAYLSTALSYGRQALPYAQADYNNNAQYSVYPQEDLIGTQELIQIAQVATGFNLSTCVNATAAGQYAGSALSEANYAMSGEDFIFTLCPYNGDDCNDPYLAYEYNSAAASSLSVAISILDRCICTAPPPSFSASPNPVQIPYGMATGTTSVSWDAPYHTSMSVYVSMDGATPTPMTSGGSSGSVSVPWIQPKHSYAFYLYDSGNIATVLAAVTVTGEVEARPTISASPTTVQIPYPKTSGSTTVSWNAPGYSAVSVYVGVDGATQTLMSSTGTSGNATPNWIVGGHSYLFSLYPTGNTNTLLNSVTVVGEALPQPTLISSVNPVVIPDGSTTGTFTLSWNAPGYSQVDAYGEQNLQDPGQKLFLGTAAGSGSASEPITVGEVATLWLYPHGDTTTLLAMLVISAHH